MSLMIMNEDLDHMIDEKTAKQIVDQWNSFESIESLAKRFKRDEWEIIFCLRHMAVNKKREIRSIGFRPKRVEGTKG